MAEQQLMIEDFSGGIARLSEKKDLPNSARLVRGFDVFSEPTALIPYAKTTKDSGTVVTDLIKWAVDGQPYDTNKYFLGNTGNIYKRTSGGTWSKLVDGPSLAYTITGGGTISQNATGQGLAVFNDYIYFCTQNSFGQVGRLSLGGSTVTSPLFGIDHTSQLLDQSATTSGQTYTVPLAISETATNLCDFTPTGGPLWVIGVTIATVGTGDWTCTVHDAANNVLGTSTVTHANIAIAGVSGDVNFYFTSLIDVVPGVAYHFHLTSTVADGAVKTANASDLSSAVFYEYKSNLVNDTDFHPMLVHLNMLVIGNGRYLATWDSTTYNPNKIVLPPGWKVRTLTREQEYIVAGCWFTSAIDGHEEGRLFYWDGIAPTYNYYKETPMGMPNALVNSKGRLLGVYGTQGRLYLGDEPFVPMLSMPKLKKDGKMEVAPGAVTNWLGLTAVGYGYNTDDASVYQGVYLWGSYSMTEGMYALNTPQGLAETASLAYQISTGNSQSTSVKIGMVTSFGKDLFIGWQDGTSYGVDKVSKGDSPTTSASWESLIFDNGTVIHEKAAHKLVMSFQPLTSGDSFTLKYRIDRAANWTTATAVTTVGATRAEFVINQRFHEIEIGFDYTTSSSTFQKVTGLAFLFDDLKEERMER